MIASKRSGPNRPRGLTTPHMFYGLEHNAAEQSHDQLDSSNDSKYYEHYPFPFVMLHYVTSDTPNNAGD